jgi:hypothetical protein
MTFEEFLDKVDNTFMLWRDASSGISADNKWRYGQTVMNILHDIWPEKYKEIYNTEYDCFYTNRTVAITLNKLEKEWNELPRSKKV